MSTRSSRNRIPLALEVHRSSRRVLLPVARIRRVIETLLLDENVTSADLSVAIVSDQEIHQVNRDHLNHDFPTDVISFLYAAERSGAQSSKGTRSRRGAGLRIEGELVVSDETAAREAAARKVTPQSELELYLVHGLLHLCGYDDLTPGERRVMRRREREITALIH
jgi:probable rRNA maturation factor